MWRLTKLKELGKVVTGSTPSTLKPENFGQGYLFIKPPDLHEGRRKIFETETEISDIGAQTQYSRLLPANTPFVVCIGTIGKLGLTTRPSFTNQQINSVLVNREEHDSVFVYYLLKNSIPEVKQLNGGSASGRENVNKSTFENIEVRVPPLPVQQRIAGILSAYDDLIENSQRRIKILELMARALYRELFVRGNAPGGILEPRVLGDICSLVKLPFSETRDCDRPLLDLSRIPQASIAPADTGLASELTTSRILFESGDTLFGAIRCYLHKVVVTHFAGVTNTSVLVLRPKTKDFRSLLAIVASDAETIRWADKHSAGTKMPVINWGVFQNMPVTIPSSALAAQFEAAAGPLIDQIGVLSMRIQNLSRTRDLLLPLLLSGQIDVEAA